MAFFAYWNCCCKVVKKTTNSLLSTIEAEDRAITQAMYEVVLMERLLQVHGIQVPRPMIVCTNNIGLIMLVNNPNLHAHCKHIEVHYHCV